MNNFEELDTSCEPDMLRFVHLHNALFPNTDASLEWMKWYFSLGQKHQGQQTRAYIVRNDVGTIIGMWCVEPKTLVFGDGRFGSVGRCFSVGIHPEFRRKNLFTELSNYAIAQERNRSAFEYIVGFPQVGRPVTSAHLKCGWEHVLRIDALGLTPSSVNQTSLTTIRRFNTPHNSSRVSVSTGGFFNTVEYRLDRWLNHPDHFYTCLGYHTAFVALKQYGSTCHILDVCGTKADVATLLAGVNTLAYRHRFGGITAWCGTQGLYREQFEAAGFQVGSSLTPSIDMLAVSIKAPNPLKLEHCDFAMGVEEIY